jgi:hypothetical protein
MRQGKCAAAPRSLVLWNDPKTNENNNDATSSGKVLLCRTGTVQFYCNQYAVHLAKYYIGKGWLRHIAKQIQIYPRLVTMTGQARNKTEPMTKSPVKRKENILTLTALACNIQEQDHSYTPRMIWLNWSNANKQLHSQNDLIELV